MSTEKDQSGAIISEEIRDYVDKMDGSDSEIKETMSASRSPLKEVNRKRKKGGHSTDLDQIGFDASRYHSPRVSPDSRWNMDRRSCSMSPYRYSKQSDIWSHSLPADNGEHDTAESKQQRHSSHESKKNLDDLCVQTKTTHDRFPKSRVYVCSGKDSERSKQKNESRERTYDRKEKHELHRYRRSLCRYAFPEGRCGRDSARKFAHEDVGEGKRKLQKNSRSPRKRDRSPETGRWNNRTSKDATKYHQSSYNGNVETNNTLSWNGPKWGDTITTVDAPNSSQWTSVADKLDSGTKTDKGSSWDKWDEAASKQASKPCGWSSECVKQGRFVNTHKSSRNGQGWGKNSVSKDDGGNVEIHNTSSWSGPKWGDVLTAVDAPNSSQWTSVADKRNSGANTDKGLSWGKWDASASKQTSEPCGWSSECVKQDRSVNTHKSSRTGQGWGKSSVSKDDGGNVEAHNTSSWSGPKWGDVLTSVDGPNTFQWNSGASTDKGSSWGKWDDAASKQSSEPCGWSSECVKQDRSMNTHKSSRTGQGWGKSSASKDGGGNVETHNTSSWSGPKWGDVLTAVDGPNTSQWTSVTDKRNSGANTDKGSSWGKWDDAASKQSSEPCGWSSECVKQDRSVITHKSSRTGQGWGKSSVSKDDGGNVESHNTKSWSGPKWGDILTAVDAPNSSQWTSVADKRNSGANTDMGSSWGKWDEAASKQTSEPCGWSSECVKQDHNVNTQKSSWDGQGWGNSSVSKNDGGNVETNNTLLWRGPKWGSALTAVDAPNSSQWTSVTDKWDQAAPKQTSKSCRWTSNRGNQDCSRKTGKTSWSGRSQGNRGNVETCTTLSWNGPKWGDAVTAVNAPNPSQWTSFTDKQDSHAKPGNSSSWDKRDRASSKQTSNPCGWSPNCSRGERTTEGAAPPERSDSANVETHHASSWNGPKWGERTKSKDNVETRNASSWIGPKWGEKTKNTDVETSRDYSWTGPKWCEKTKNTDVETGRDYSWTASSWNGPEWGERTDSKNNVETSNASSWNGPKWGEKTKNTDVETGRDYSWTGSKQTITKDAQNSGEWDKYVRNSDSSFGSRSIWGDRTVKEATTDNRVPLSCPRWGDPVTNKKQDGPKWGEKASTQLSPIPSQQRAEKDNVSSLDVSKQGDQKSTRNASEAPNSSKWSRNNAGIGISAAHSAEIEYTRREPLPNPQKVTRHTSPKAGGLVEDSGKDVRNSNLDFIGLEVQDEQSSKLGKIWKSLFRADKTGSTASWVSLNGEDAEPEPPSGQQILKFDKKVLSSGKKPQQSGEDATPPPPSNQHSQESEQQVLSSGKKPQQSEENTTPPPPSNQPSQDPEQQLLGKGKQLQELSVTPNPVIALEPYAAGADPLSVGGHPYNQNADTKRGADKGISADKGIRMFKFALVRFSKGILKPKVNAGYLSNENLQIIVKKVIAKVIVTLTDHNIPCSQEGVDRYMATHKPNLTKLVVEYFQMYMKK